VQRVENQRGKRRVGERQRRGDLTDVAVVIQPMRRANGRRSPDIVVQIGDEGRVGHQVRPGQAGENAEGEQQQRGVGQQR
jgi:hypothetical protein